jgi:hypothetical protein
MKICGHEYSWMEFLCLLILAIAVWFALNVFYLWLWSIIAVKIFALPALNFWQMIGLRLLTRSLFTGTDLNSLMANDA